MPDSLRAGMAAPGKPPTVDGKPVAARPCPKTGAEMWKYLLTGPTPPDLYLPAAVVLPDKP